MGGIVKNFGFKVQHGPLDINKLSKIIEDAYLSYNEVVDTKKKSFAPSKIGFGSGKCPRYWYIAFDGAPFDDEKKPQDIANMRSGIDAHTRLGEVLKKSILNIEALEKPVEFSDPPIFGFVDIIIDRSGEKVIGEIKTTKSESFASRRVKMTPPDYHLIQILIYMKILEADSGFFLYENKNTHELLIMPVYMDEENRELVDSVFEWMRVVRKSWEDKELPERAFTKKSRECKDCPVRSVCWEGDKYGDGTVTIDSLRLL